MPMCSHADLVLALACRQLQVTGTQSSSCHIDEAILHLVVRRGTSVGWSHANHEFQLAVPGHETADAVKRRIEASSGLDSGSHMLLYKGQVGTPCPWLLFRAFGIAKCCKTASG